MERITRLVQLLALSGLASVSWSGAWAADSAAYAPPVYGTDRYDHLWKQSPFVVATQVVQEAPALAQRFALAGLAKVGDKPVAFLIDRRTQSRVMVVEGEKTDGVELLATRYDVDLLKSAATIRLGADQATIGYDPTLASPSSSAPNAAGPALSDNASSSASPESRPPVKLPELNAVEAAARAVPGKKPDENKSFIKTR